MDGVGGSSPPASTKFVASCSLLVSPKGKKNKHSSDIKRNTKNDITELKKKGKEMKKKGICLVLAMMLILGVVGSTGLAANRPQSVFSGGLSVWYWPGEGSITSIDIGYEKTLNAGFALHGKGSLGLESGVTILGGLVGVKKYLGPTAPEGLWIGGFASMTDFSAPLGGGLRISANVFGFGAEGGYRYFFTPNLSVEPFAQAGYYTAEVGFAFTLGVNLGYTF